VDPVTAKRGGRAGEPPPSAGLSPSAPLPTAGALAPNPPLAPAPLPPPLRPGDPPLVVLVDYDGTVAQTDVSDALLAEFVTEEWEAKAAEYDVGLSGSRRLMEWEVGLITASPPSLRTLAAGQPHDAGFAPFVRRAREAGVPVEVVSDGFGFFIPAALEALGVGDVPVVSADTTFPAGERPRIAFPNGHPRCFVCGTCKRARVLAWQASGRAVVFVGDGESDRYAAGYSDVIFAKHALLRLCVENGWPFRRWTEFAEIDAWLDGVIDAWRADPTSSLVPRPTAKPFICGPEAWGEGRWDPPARIKSARRPTDGSSACPATRTLPSLATRRSRRRVERHWRSERGALTLSW
jgi:2,3-diketo-5-methylthio-1-phosphopentane phosphatase